MSAITLCLRDPALRAAGLVMALQGAIACSFGPYFSTLAVHSFGFGDRGYAVLLVLSSLVSVSASVIGGIRADQTANRRQVTLVAVCSLLLGTVLMTATPGPAIFALTAALLIPISSITFGQVFVAATSDFDSGVSGTALPSSNRPSCARSESCWACCR